ncbi:hypothetical protein HK096_008780 [Nowakowskiella sp. JEL0078]|nr:hypothetical protein HK096_008780 [Nowakowskiella sp. JEL0078]
MMSQGFTGEGFESEGRRLGQKVSHNAPIHLARQKALEAAEKRRKTNQIMGIVGGHRLGGNGFTGMQNVLRPAQMAAMAAERRLIDKVWCGNEEFDNIEITKAIDASFEKPSRSTGVVNDIVEDHGAKIF